MNLKSLSILFITLISTLSFAQTMDPSQIADQFIACTSQSQTQQLLVPMRDENTAVTGQFIVTDAPGSQNILEMVQLNVLAASFDDQTINIEATGMVNFNKTYNLTANAAGEFNISPSLKTMVYLGSFNGSGAATEGYTCVVLTADQLGQMNQN